MTARRHILVVDDDLDLAESLAEVLERRGYAVATAGSGEEGLELFRATDFDLVLTDVKLPGMNGVETFFAFRELKPDAKVMLMTGFSVENLIRQALDNGALGVLRKPFAMTDVLSTVQELDSHGIVLIADDDPDLASSLEPHLTRAGYRVRVAKNGAEAFQTVLDARIDCLILDLKMPVLDGVEVYTRLCEQGRAVPTIIVTAYAAEEAGQNSLLDTMAERMLMKPVDPNQLVRAIDSLLRDAA